MRRHQTAPTLTHKLWGCVRKVVGSHLGLTGVYSGCVMIGSHPAFAVLVMVSGLGPLRSRESMCSLLASNYFRIRALLSTADFPKPGSKCLAARRRYCVHYGVRHTKRTEE
jgi:hypothetical protein